MLLRRRAPLLCALLCAGGVLVWQTLTVRYNYNGNWSALFHTGSWSAPPSELAFERIFTFENSRGYDGQFYHYVAHDPFLSRGFAAHVDNPRLRWRRILTPLSAHLLALGRPRYIDAAYLGVMLSFVSLGAYWLSRWCTAHNLHPYWGLTFPLVPAALISIDRMTIDLPLAALCIAFAVYHDSWKLYLVLALAPLVRETGFALVLGYGLYQIANRAWLPALGAAGTAVPAAAWIWFVHQRTPADLTVWTSSIPFQGLVQRTLHPVQFPLTSSWLVKAAVFDYLALLGVWLALLLSARLIWSRSFGPVEAVVAVFAASAAFLGRHDIWAGAYEFGRTMSPLLLLLALHGAATRFWWNLLPICLALPRLALQLKPQWSGILSRIAHPLP